MKKIIALVCILTISLTTFAQSVIGKWQIIQIKDPEVGIVNLTKEGIKAQIIAETKKELKKKTLNAEELEAVESLLQEAVAEIGIMTAEFNEDGTYELSMGKDITKGTFTENKKLKKIISVNEDDTKETFTYSFTKERLTINLTSKNYMVLVKFIEQ